MSEKEKPLPMPPTSPFGLKKRLEESEENTPLMADQMAAAMAEGKLEEFLQHEMPDNEYARTLAMMMMGMTGILPPECLPSAPEKKDTPSHVSKETELPSGALPPQDVLNAVQAGDVKNLIELLEREHKKRMPDAEINPIEGKKVNHSPELTGTEKETIDSLMKIASENNLAVDWIILRALKTYIQEYQKSGRL